MADITAESVTELALQKRYRQPRGVEQFGIEAIPQERKTVRWYDLFSIILNFLVSPSTILRGGLGVAAGLSFQASVLAECSGIVVAAFFYVVMATVGVDYGIPGQVATRAIYGLRGSKLIPSFLRSLASCYWFAFQTVIGATAIVAVLQKLTGTQYSLILVSVLFGIVQAMVAIVGYESLKALSRVALPVKLAMFVYLCSKLLANQSDPNFAPGAVLSCSTGKGDGGVRNCDLCRLNTNAAAAGWLTMITGSPCGFLPLLAQSRRYVDRHDLRLGDRHDDLGLARRLRRCGDARQDRQPVRRRRQCQHKLDHAGLDLGVHRARQLDDQRPQPLYRRSVDLEHVRAARPVLDDLDRQRRRHRAVGDPRRAEQLSQLCDLAGQFLLADRRGAGVRLPDPKAHPARRTGPVSR